MTVATALARSDVADAATGRLLLDGHGVRDLDCHDLAEGRRAEGPS